MKVELSPRGVFKILGGAILLLLLGVLAHGEECKQVVYSAHPNYPPYHWAEDGKIVGASADIAEMILDELGVHYQSRFVGPWKRVLYNAEKGSVDLVLSLKDVPERRNYLTFTGEAFYENPVGVFMHKDHSFTFNDWNDLINKRGTLNLGDRHGEAFDSFAQDYLKVVRVAGLEANFNALYFGRSTFFVTGLYTGRAFLAKYAHGDDITYAEKPVVFGDIHHGFSNKSACLSLLPYFNRRLKEMREDGTTKAAMERNLKKWKTSKVSLSVL